ncbi:MAG: hypothetical protein K2K68_11045 [Duncaniella sp.]|nr:hypothetical protein [Duncaniella sp.]MDE6582049.1 hypothetical protein [Duncaniella sp.]
MKRFPFFLMTIFTFLSCYAQECPSEWVKYTYGGYFYDIQSDNNNRRHAEVDFKNNLVNSARASLAKQIKMSVKDMAQMNKTAIDGRTSITYSSNTSFSTDLNMKLVETKSMYSPSTGEGYAIAYIDKDAAKNYYTNELTVVRNKITNSIELADSYIEGGFKKKAELELNKSLKLFDSVDESLFWLNIFGAGQSEINDWQLNFNQAEQNVKRQLADLKHATVIYLSCNADLFGKTYPTLQNELKGKLAAKGCSFTDYPQNADWVITVNCSAREHSNVKAGNSNAFFTYIDAAISIDKTISSQRIYEDEVSVKGSHTFGYQEAAKAGYKDITKELSKIINITIDQ